MPAEHNRRANLHATFFSTNPENALMKLLANKELAKKMGEAGRERIKEKFTIQRMINNYEALFMKILK